MGRGAAGVSVSGAVTSNANGRVEGTGTSATVSYFGNFANLGLSGGNDVVLDNFTPVPEPGSILGLATAV